MNESTRSLEKTVTMVVLIVLLVLLVGIGVSVWKRQNVPKIDPNVYQGVFLTNNQQYFGHLKNFNTRHPYLTDVYYVQTQNSPANPAEQAFNLVKLGAEIHGPEDVLYLNWKNVLFWENLKSDSRVSRGIVQEKLQRVNPGMPVNP
jgi:hypothetical protein